MIPAIRGFLVALALGLFGSAQAAGLAVAVIGDLSNKNIELVKEAFQARPIEAAPGDTEATLTVTIDDGRELAVGCSCADAPFAPNVIWLWRRNDDQALNFYLGRTQFAPRPLATMIDEIIEATHAEYRKRSQGR